MVCGPVYVCSLAVKPKLCCHKKDCKPCLWINIQLSIIPDLKEEEEEDRDIERSEYELESSGEFFPATAHNSCWPNGLCVH